MQLYLTALIGMLGEDNDNIIIMIILMGLHRCFYVSFPSAILGQTGGPPRNGNIEGDSYGAYGGLYRAAE